MAASSSEGPAMDLHQPQGVEKVVLLTFTGSYKDRCTQLGQELYEDVVKAKEVERLIHDLPEQMKTDDGKAMMDRLILELTHFAENVPTPEQRELRTICEEMGLPELTCRPDWAGGAHVFVNKQAALALQDTFEGQLRKEHVVVSPEFLDLVTGVMVADVKGKSPKLKREEFVVLAPPRAAPAEAPRDASPSHVAIGILEELPEVLSILKAEGIIAQVEVREVGRAPSQKTRGTHTTGEQPRSLRKRVEMFQQSRKHFKLTGSLSALRAASRGASADPNQGSGPDGSESPDGRGSSHDCDPPHDSSGDPDLGADGSRGSKGGHDSPHGGPGDLEKGADGSQDARPRDVLSRWIQLSAMLLKNVLTKDALKAADECCADDGKSEAQSTIATGLETVYQSQEGWRSALHELVDRATVIHEPIVTKTSSQFQDHISERMTSFIGDVMRPFVDADLAAKVLAAAGDNPRSRAKKALKLLADRAKLCHESDVLERFLAGGVGTSDDAVRRSRSAEGWRRAFATVVPRVAEAMQAAIEPHFKEAIQRERASLKRAGVEDSEGPHAVADKLKESVVKAFSEALVAAKVSILAERKWNEQKEEHKVTSKQQAKRAASVGTVASAAWETDRGVHCGLAIENAGSVPTEFLVQKTPMKHSGYGRPGKSALAREKLSKKVMFET